MAERVVDVLKKCRKYPGVGSEQQLESRQEEIRRCCIVEYIDTNRMIKCDFIRGAQQGEIGIGAATLHS